MNLQLRAKLGKIGVLMGGPSAEREISLKSGKAVFQALEESGLEVLAIDIVSDAIDENKNLLRSLNLNCAFIALHGRFGEDGQIQRILDDLEIFYTGSGARSSELAMDKIASRKIFKDGGLSVPKYEVLKRSPRGIQSLEAIDLNFPLVIKPSNGGSSIGLSIIDGPQGWEKALSLAFSFDDRILVEEFVGGREMTVGILQEKALPVIEIIPKKGFFDFEAKYHSGLAEYVVPAAIDDLVAKKVQECALSAHRLLGCYGCSREDIILTLTNQPYILEVNTIPGMTSTSLLPKAAKAVSLDFAHLCLRLIELAYEKK
jgi:D-alanine-D-alanine ligase